AGSTSQCVGQECSTRRESSSQAERPCAAVVSGPAVLLVFFFESRGDHRDLHSFPTRRSSDLVLFRPLPFKDADRLVLVGDWLPRSEEHTSELQSPCNLVCRLLLEKKNRNESRARPIPPSGGSGRGLSAFAAGELVVIDVRRLL